MAGPEVAVAAAVAPELLAAIDFTGMAAGAAIPTVAIPYAAAGAPLIGAGMGALAPSMAAAGAGLAGMSGMAGALSTPALLELSGMPGITPPSFDAAATLINEPSLTGLSPLTHYFGSFAPHTFGGAAQSLTGVSPLTADASIMGDAALPEGVAYKGLEKPFDWMKLGKNMYSIQQALGGQKEKQQAMSVPEMGTPQMSEPRKMGNQGLNAQTNPYLQTLLQNRLSQLLLSRR